MHRKRRHPHNPGRPKNSKNKTVRVLIGVLSLMLCACNESAEPPAGPSSAETRQPDAGRPTAGLFSTLPILWNETAEFGDLLSGSDDAGRNPVRAALERRFDLSPLDTLDAEALSGFDTVILAQPRVLSPSENVALDNYVRVGGKVVLFADPMLTGHSRYALGDPRRPQDTVLLSPILSRWELELRFDTEQASGERTADAFGVAIPIDMAGTFVAQSGENAGSTCDPAEGLAVACEIGEGRLYAIADAAILQPHDDSDGKGDPLAELFSRFAD